MASYQQVIELVVKGQEQLAKLERRVKELNKEADKLRTEPAKAGTGALAETIKEAADGQKALNKASKQDLLNRIKLNAAIDLYGRRLQQIQTTAATDQKQFAGRLKEIQAAFQVFKTDKDLGGIQAVATELGRILQTSREINRAEAGRIKSQLRLQGYVRDIAELKAAGLNTAAAENLLEKAKVNLGTKRFNLAKGLEVRLQNRITLLKKEKNQIDANTRAAERRAKAAAKAKSQRRQDLALGAGFPLLFGGGAGQVLGGLAGAALGGGFGGQILGSALGQQLEDALRRIQEIDIALQTLDMDALADSAIIVNAELRQTVQNLVDLGESQKAVELATAEVSMQTGLLPESIKDASDAVNLLSNVWDELVGRVSGLLALVGTPLLNALSMLLKVVSEIVKPVNFILSLLLRSGNNLEGINETEEKRLATLRQTSTELEKELGREKEIFAIEQRRVAGNTAAAKLENAQASRDKALKKLQIATEKKILENRGKFADIQGHVAKVEKEYQEVLILESAEIEKQRVLKKFSLDEEAAGRLRAKELAKQQAEETKQALDAQKQALQTNLDILQNTLSIEKERNNLATSKINLDQTLSNIRLKDFDFIKAAREAGLSELNQLKLMGLERLNNLNLEERLVLLGKSNVAFSKEEEKILRKQFAAKLKAADIEYESQLLSIDASVSKAKIEQQLTQIKSDQLKIQLTSLRIEAQGIKNADERAAAFTEINRQQVLVDKQTAEIQRLAKNNLDTVIEQADIQRQIAKNKYEELKATIRSEELERRRAKALSEIEARSARIAQNTKEAAEASNKISSTTSGSGGGGIGSTTTQTMSTSLPIDPDVQKAVIDRAGPFGYRNVSELIRKLEEAQKIKNARTAREAKMSQPSSSSFASSSSYGPRPSSGGGSGTATVNVSTGPVMQVDNKRYVSMEDFESGLREVARSTAQTSRSYGSRRYSGIG